MRALLLAGVVAVGWAGSAKAIVTEYTSQSLFNAAASSPAVNTFSGFPNDFTIVASPYSYGVLTFVAPGFNSIKQGNDGFLGAGVEYVGIIRNHSPVTINLASGASAVGFYLSSFNGADTVNVSINGAVQTPLVTIGGYQYPAFIGFTDSDPINSLSFSLASGSELDFIKFQIQSFVTPVPEPASLALLGIGLIGAAAVRRVRQG